MVHIFVAAISSFVVLGDEIVCSGAVTKPQWYQSSFVVLGDKIVCSGCGDEAPMVRYNMVCGIGIFL